MPKYDKIEELLNELYQHRRLFASLFERRMVEVSEEAVLELMDGSPEKLDRLADYGLMVRTPGHVKLADDLEGFFSEYMEVDETVHVLYIRENLEEIKKQQSYWLKDRQERYLLKIRKQLRGIIRIATLNVKTLRNNMEETYTTEGNFEVKRQKLEDVRDQRDALEGIIRAVERMLEDDMFFRSASDEEMLHIIHLLKLVMHESRHNLIEIQHKVIAYLNHIEQRAAVVDKVLRLKMLKDRHYLQQQSNFYLVAEACTDLPMAGNEPLRSRLSLPAMRDEEAMQKLVLKVRARQKLHTLLAQNTAGEMPERVLGAEESVESGINLYALKNIFLKRDGDLFSFVMEHEFDIPVTEDGRIGLFCQLASRFAAELDFPNETRQVDGLEVAVIHGKERS